MVRRIIDSLRLDRPYPSWDEVQRTVGVVPCTFQRVPFASSRRQSWVSGRPPQPTMVSGIGSPEYTGSALEDVLGSWSKPTMSRPYLQAVALIFCTKRQAAAQFCPFWPP